MRNETQLQELVSNFNTTMAALASEESNLQRVDPRARADARERERARFASLNEAFPPTRAFAREILPGVRETAATIDASFPWVEQMRGLMSQVRAAAVSRRTSRPRRATSRS